MEPVTPQAAKRLIAEKLAEIGKPGLKLTARTISFSDLARASCVFVKVHGWTPSPEWSLLQETARAHGFRVEA